MNSCYYPDIISAISTPQGSGAISIVRVSGKSLAVFVENLLGHAVAPHKPSLATICDTAGHLIDHVLVLFFPAPHSYTGEDILEIHGHGGIVVTHMVLDQCLHKGARLAEPGEFTLRAYYNHKVDLTQVEAIAEIIHAQSEFAVKAAAQSIQGVFSDVVAEIKEQLTKTRMQIEAHIDFPDEGISLSEMEIYNEIQLIKKNLAHIIQQSNNATLRNRGARVVLAGAVNAGKSSLMNCLSKKNRSIVSAFPGTTRDTIEETLFIDQFPIHFVDTAGLNNDTQDVIEKMGIEKSWDEIRRADLVLYLVDSTKKDFDADKETLQKFPLETKYIIVLNKIDQPATQQRAAFLSDQMSLSISARENTGIDSLLSAIKQEIADQNMPDHIISMNKRQTHQVKQAFERVCTAEEHQRSLEIVADALQWASHALEEIIGTIPNEKILSEIFSHFCLGK